MNFEEHIGAPFDNFDDHVAGHGFNCKDTGINQQFQLSAVKYPSEMDYNLPLAQNCL